MGKMRSKVLIILLILIGVPLCHATTVDFYTDGTINSGDLYDIANVWDTATVEVYGGLVGQLINHDSGTINFYAGTVTSVSLQNTSTFNLDGTLTCNDFGIGHSSIFNINGGAFDGSISGSGNQVVVTSGMVNISESVITNDTVTSIYGGTISFEDILFDREAILNIYGGDVTFNRDSFGDAFRLGVDAKFNVYYSSIIYGTSNEIIGYYLIDSNEFMLNQFTQAEISQINFVPEPGTFLLVGLGGLLLRKRK